MINIKKLANLTGLALSPDEEVLLGGQLESVASLLDKMKAYEIETPTQTRHELLGLSSMPQQSGLPDSDPDAILANISHPITGHAVEVRAFVE